jgi:2-amino-4-hydroxy-6-hydroxymethyldihydropteridine diphosphokinase
MRHIAYLGLGSNLGDRIEQCEKAIAEILKINRHKLLAKSSFYRTRPIGYTSQDPFVNGVIKIETDLEPLDLLGDLKRIESSLGRVRTFRGGPRSIDIDILFFDAEEMKTGALQIPHPSLHQRQFVLVPMAEIDRDLVHPVLKKSIRELLEDLKEDQGVEKLIVPSTPVS